MSDRDPGRSLPQPAGRCRQVQVGDRFPAVRVVPDTTGIAASAAGAAEQAVAALTIPPQGHWCNINEPFVRRACS